MRRKIISIDEYMTMNEQELKYFIDNYNLILDEGNVREGQSNIDFKGLTIKDTVKKYDCEDIDSVFEKIKNKLGY